MSKISVDIGSREKNQVLGILMNANDSFKGLCNVQNAFRPDHFKVKATG
jgi:hypothetical protein